jgi:hypothetical protein
MEKLSKKRKLFLKEISIWVIALFILTLIIIFLTLLAINFMDEKLRGDEKKILTELKDTSVSYTNIKNYFY